jgi:hypothetical protein
MAGARVSVGVTTNTAAQGGSPSAASAFNTDQLREKRRALQNALREQMIEVLSEFAVLITPEDERSREFAIPFQTDAGVEYKTLRVQGSGGFSDTRIEYDTTYLYGSSRAKEGQVVVTDGFRSYDPTSARRNKHLVDVSIGIPDGYHYRSYICHPDDNNNGHYTSHAFDLTKFPDQMPMFKKSMRGVYGEEAKAQPEITFKEAMRAYFVDVVGATPLTAEMRAQYSADPKLPKVEFVELLLGGVAESKPAVAPAPQVVEGWPEWLARQASKLKPW